MIKLAIEMRCKEFRYYVRSCRKIVEANGKFGRFMTAVLVLIKHFMMWPLMLPFRLFNGTILAIVAGFGIKIEEHLYFDKLGDVIAEYRELLKELKKG